MDSGRILHFKVAIILKIIRRLEKVGHVVRLSKPRTYQSYPMDFDCTGQNSIQFLYIGMLIFLTEGMISHRNSAVEAKYDDIMAFSK